MIDIFPWTDAADTQAVDLDELLIHLPYGYENNGYPTLPDDVPGCAKCPACELASVHADPEGWHPEPIASGLTVAEARDLANELGAARVIGD